MSSVLQIGMMGTYNGWISNKLRSRFKAELKQNRKTQVLPCKLWVCIQYITYKGFFLAKLTNIHL